MSFITQSEPDVVELSSDEESITSLTNRFPNPRERSSSPDTQCPICLDGLTNKCYTNSCLHLFCFECLKRWSISEPSCPLCKQVFNRIFHSFDGKGDHRIYNIPTRTSSEPVLLPRPSLPVADLTVNFFLDIIHSHERQRQERINNMNQLARLFGPGFNDNGRLNDDNRDFLFPPQRLSNISGQSLRVLVYAHNAWALPLPDPTSRFRECNLGYFRNNPGEVRRLEPFIIRDLIAIKEIARQAGQHTMSDMLDNNVTTVTNMILRTLTSYEIREGFMINILRPYLHWQALHFCHEFYNFACSPYDMPDYDRYVRFSLQSRTARTGHTSTHPPLLLEDLSNVLSGFASSPPPPSPPPAIPLENPVQRVIGETIVLDSDNEEPQLPEVIVVDSSSDDSDVEILSPSVQPNESLNSDSIDQPSTSTGIRDSLDRPNYFRYSLKRRKNFNEDSSSSDED